MCKRLNKYTTHIFVIALLLLSFKSFAKEHTMKLTFTDGYSQQPIANQPVKIEIKNQKWSRILLTDATGSVVMVFKAKKFIDYEFGFVSGDFEPQLRKRYLSYDGYDEIDFDMYPSAAYEARILEQETGLLSAFEKIPEGSDCFNPQLPDAETLGMFVDERLQVPATYGDYGYQLHFLIEFTLTAEGKPYLVSILESSDPEMNMEAVRLVRAFRVPVTDACENRQYQKTVRMPLDIDREL